MNHKKVLKRIENLEKCAKKKKKDESLKIAAIEFIKIAFLVIQIIQHFFNN